MNQNFSDGLLSAGLFIGGLAASWLAMVLAYFAASARHHHADLRRQEEEIHTILCYYNSTTAPYSSDIEEMRKKQQRIVRTFRRLKWPSLIASILSMVLFVVGVFVGGIAIMSAP